MSTPARAPDGKPAPPISVIVDTREQQPLRPGLLDGAERVPLPSIIRGLRAGDYSAEGLEDVIRFERKSLVDLWGTLLGKGEADELGEERRPLDRFRGELLLLAALPRARIVVHGSTVEDAARRPVWCPGTPEGLLLMARCRFARGGQHFAERNAASVMALLASFDADYDVPTIWCETRGRAELYVGRTLSRVWEQHVDGRAASKAAGRGLVLPWALTPASPDPRTTSPRIRHVNPNPAAHTTTRGGYTRGAPSR